MEPVEIKTLKYRFLVSQKYPDIVQIDVYLNPPMDLGDEDVKEVKEILNEIGKWEDFVEAGKSALEDLGILRYRSQAEFNERKKERERYVKFQNRKYEYKIDLRDRDVIRVFAKVSKEERDWRGQITIDEIKGKLENVEKWLNLQAFLEELKLRDILRNKFRHNDLMEKLESIRQEIGSKIVEERE